MIALHVDLLHTDLEDFIAHFEDAIQRYPELFIESIGEPMAHQDERIKAKVREIEGLPPEPMASLPREPVVRWDDKPNPDIDPTQHLTIDVARVRSINKTLPEQAYMVRMEGELLFILNAIRYRRDRLRIVLTEPGKTPVHAPKILHWFKLRWGDGRGGIIELNPFDAPPEKAFEPLPEPDQIIKYMETFGYAMDSPEWWDIYLTWFFAYRERNGKKSLTQALAIQLASSSASSFNRELRAWEKRTCRERDTRRYLKK